MGRGGWPRSRWRRGAEPPGRRPEAAGAKVRPAPTPAAGGRPPTPPATAAPRCFRTLHGSSGPNSRQEAARAEHSEPQPSPHKRSRPRGARGTNPRPAPQPWLLDSSKRLRSDPAAARGPNGPARGPAPRRVNAVLGLGCAPSHFKPPASLCIGEEGGAPRSFLFEFDQGGPKNAPSHFKPMSSNGASES